MCKGAVEGDVPEGKTGSAGSGETHAGQPKHGHGAGRNWQGEWPKTPGRLIGTGLIRLYQITLSPIVGRSCRHLPTCSEYGYEAIARHGLLPGSWLTFWRVLKCNPLGTSGIDPVPEKMRWALRRGTAGQKAAGQKSFEKTGHDRSA
ncbi:MAG: membrane protein insertion efficiency factor YidD [Nitratireductor sp.]|nr:membrane protein insertion efficiency factor YidD [Nitratireductor sp.]